VLPELWFSSSLFLQTEIIEAAGSTTVVVVRPARLAVTIDYYYY
jgi:hypothetical protein